ncbi:hypothetical protein AJ80_04565 [Polytolypa hystricis UAMH7299]|uniref:Presequence protease, mitochondrial n=1 Tax=Polytolypa hystricis (strain UAMH7299) TaxID=1447883 RepID=A0A2B7YB82_POLH7|nr:hypothetical protein AJ80_04565 [Polytolypa hystricis UAMH7299]
MLRPSSRVLSCRAVPPLAHSRPLRNRLRQSYLCPLSRRNASTVTLLESYPGIGEKLQGFTVQQKKHVPELHLTAVLLKHDKTSADYLHVARDDKNNVFSIGFKTNPPDATGIPHILEHTTLCGSEKYPVRDPFFKMLPRSLSNFMNAFTSSDHTSYPFATTNKQDFQNLLSVYLDATLHPLLKEEDFRQEGWRLGPENPRAAEENKTSSDNLPASADDVVFKGVVYNEMKGQMSDANYLFWIRFKEQIFPAINNSGGDPESITDLTHQQLVNFSRKNYHPSNAKLFSYGDMPLGDHLKQVGQVLDGFQEASADKDVKLPRDLSQGPVDVTVSGPVDSFTSEDKQFKTSTSWLAGDSTDIVETFSLGIASSLLLDGYGSPMYRALVESGIGSSFTPNTGLDTSGKVPIFSVGVNGVSEQDASTVNAKVQTVFQETLSAGFSDEKVQGILHQLELALRHKTANFGMGIMEKTLSSWFNGADPIKELAWNDVINEFKRRYEQGGYLEQLVHKYLMNNNAMTFTMVGSPTYNQELDEKELVRRETKLGELSAKAGSLESAIEQLKVEELELLKVQEAAQHADLSCLPTLRVKDISRQKERKHIRKGEIENVEVQWREAPTNGLTYFQAMNPLQGLPDELRLLLPLFNDCIMRLGTPTRTMEQWEDLIKLKTGGLTSSTFVVSSPKSLNRFSEGMQFSGYCLDENVSTMLEMISSLVMETNFKNPMAPALIQELLRSSTNGALDAVAGTGHRYAVNAASSGLSKKFWVQDQYSGLAQIQATARFLHDAESSPARMQELIQKLCAIQSFAISRSPKFRVRMVCEAEKSAENETVLQKWLAHLPRNVNPATTGSGLDGSGFDSVPASNKILYELPYKVSYSGLVLETAPFFDPASASLSVLAQLLTHNYLHPEIREKGGAYGASASSRPTQGLFSLSSYRDPNPMNTLKIFNSTGIFARDRSWTDRQLEEAKLGIFQSLDAPMSVDEEGQRFFMTGVTEERDQRWREQVLDVTAKDVNDVAQRYLVEASRKVFCLLGENKDPSDLDGWDIRKLSMGATQEIPLDSSQGAVAGSV